MATDTVTALRHKFMVVALAALTSALLIIFAVLNILNHALATQRVDSVITVLHEHDGTFPEDWKKHDPRYKKGTFQATSETPYETRYLVAEFDHNRTITELDTSHIAQLDEAEARSAVSSMLAQRLESGYYQRYRYHVYTEDDGSGMIIVVDCFQQLQSSRTLLIISVALIGTTVLGTLLFITPLSRRVVDPYVRNLERQKRFVTDASHELKTPIAIIAANTDLIEATEGQSTWTKSTRAQTARLTKLTGELIELARSDEPIAQELCIDVDVATLVEGAIEEFAPLAEAGGKTLGYHVQTAEGTSLRNEDASERRPLVSGSPEELTRLVNVLLDNAVRYCDDGGAIDVRLEVRRREVELVVTNPCAALTVADTRRLFDRFYRADASRSRSTGGNGIGLSIAQGIVTRHKGSIHARKLGVDLEMRVELPRR